MILAGDIGGTKTNLALFEAEGEGLQRIAQQQFASRIYSSLIEVIEAFEILQDMPVRAACFGIAGPVIDGRCRTTNLPWDVSTQGLQQALNITNVMLLNDLEATAYGMLYLDEDSFVSLNPTGRKREGNRAVIAAGTGLGEAMLFYDGSGYHPIGSEGGHCDFASATPQQDELLQWLRHRFAGHVSYERILSGPGIYTLYEFLAQSGFAPEPYKMQHLEVGVDRSAMVSQLALQEHDALCLETLRLFCEIYGAEAGNLALKSMSVGGVFIGGGIAPKILPIMQEEHFMNGFLSKGRFEELLRGMEVTLSLNPETALLGAAHYGVDSLKRA